MSDLPRSRGRPLPRPAWWLALLAALVYVAGFAATVSRPSYDIPAAIAIVPALLMMAVVVARRFQRAQPDRWVRRIIAWSLALKIVATGARYFFAFVVYGGSADAAGYHGHGTRIAASLQALEFGDISLQDALGTEAMRLLTGIVYAMTGPSIYVGFLVFALLAWGGTYLFLRAFQVSEPTGDHRLYAALTMLLPSMLYWPASIGKETWMIFTLGLASLGVAKVFAGRSHGFILLVAGVAGAAWLRPHMAVLVLMAVAGALVFSRARRRGSWVATSLLSVVIVVLGAFVAEQAQEFFNVEVLSVEAVGGVLETTSVNTAQGGSEFENVSVSNPLLFPLGFVSVVFRPFPFEAPNAQALLLSFEGLLLAIVLWLRRRNVIASLRRIRANRYVAFASLYAAGFVVAFSNFNNLGLLARERVQLYPLLFVLLAVTSRRPIPVHQGQELLPAPVRVSSRR